MLQPMLTVLEAARRLNREPETVRRWIRSGRLPARKIGTRHFIEESDLLNLVSLETLPLPRAWQKTFWGVPMPNVIGWLRASRTLH